MFYCSKMDMGYGVIHVVRKSIASFQVKIDVESYLFPANGNMMKLSYSEEGDFLKTSSFIRIARLVLGLMSSFISVKCRKFCKKSKSCVQVQWTCVSINYCHERVKTAITSW